MLNQTSQEFRILFLLKFTEELIKNSQTAEALALRKRLREKIKENVEKKENEERLKRIVEKKAITKELEELSEERTKTQKKPKFEIKETKIPLPNIPITIKNIIPSPTEQEIDLGKLNSLIRDPTVISIECNGTGKNIIVRRIKGEKRITGIILDKNEIDRLIGLFSEEAKIPSHEGIFKAAVGKLVISAIISDIADSKFLISKLSPFEYYAR
jgi:ATPase subunit of ABC transporter with duplicated ATPase domains